jgi:hypothetical protein
MMNIKNYRLVSILFLSLMFVFQACSKKEAIDLKPEFTVDAIFNPSTMGQVEEVLLGAYAALRNGDYYGSNSGTGAGWVTTPDVLSDNLYESASESLANSRRLADWTYDESVGLIGGLLTAPYFVISRANLVLRDVDKFTTPANQTQANRLKGQALALRAMAHFDMMRYFSVTYDRNSSELAVPYVKEFLISTKFLPARNTNKEVYDAIFADLTAAQTLLSNVDRPVNPAGLTRPFIDNIVVNAILARVHLYAGEWPQAVTAATAAINARPLVNLNQAAFSGMYNQTNLGEIIWNVQFEAGQGGPTFQVYFATVARSYFRPESAIATVAGNTGLIQSNDIRYSAFFTANSGGLAVTKYRGKQAADGNANAIPFRTGEMYLIRAEALARQGGANEAQAMASLNTLRAARITGYVNQNLTGQALLDAIANERRRELFCEGHRFFDLKRTTRTITRGVECGNVQISAAGNCSLLPNAREWAMPIPQAERDVNPNFAQNPGYN